MSTSNAGERVWLRRAATVLVMLGLGAASFAGATMALGGTLFGTLSAKERPASPNGNPKSDAENGNLQRDPAKQGAHSDNGNPKSDAANGNGIGAPSENGNPKSANRPGATDPSAREATSARSKPSEGSQRTDARTAKGARARSAKLKSLDGDVHLERPDSSPSGDRVGVDGSLARTANGCPEDMVRAGRACVDAFEAHLEVLAADGAYVPWPHQLRPPSHGRYRAAVGAAMPQPYVSREEALRACHNAKKRLCRLSEWKRACRGPKPTTYPYGNRERPGRCNTGKPHLLTELFGADNRGWEYDRHFNAPELALIAGYLAKSGTFEGCTTREGTFDMVGNLHEWVEDRVTSGLMRRLREESVYREPQPWHVGNGIFVGGFFSTKSEHGPGCHFITVAHGASYHDYSTGFRCCVDGTDAALPHGASP